VLLLIPGLPFLGFLILLVLTSLPMVDTVMVIPHIVVFPHVLTRLLNQPVDVVEQLFVIGVSLLLLQRLYDVCFHKFG